MPIRGGVHRLFFSEIFCHSSKPLNSLGILKPAPYRRWDCMASGIAHYCAYGARDIGIIGRLWGRSWWFWWVYRCEICFKVVCCVLNAVHYQALFLLVMGACFKPLTLSHLYTAIRSLSSILYLTPKHYYSKALKRRYRAATGIRIDLAYLGVF